MTHPDDEQLSRFLDDDDVDIAAHVAACAVCAARVATLRAVGRAVHAGDAPSVVDAVLRRLEAPPWWSMWSSWRVPVAAFASCAALVGVLMVRAPSTSTTTAADTFTARGAPSRAALVLLNDGVAVDTGATVSSTSSWRADVVNAADERLAVVAIDARGDVHWLRPTWTELTSPPPCPAPIVGARSLAPETVAFTLPAGPLVVKALRLPQSCAVPTIDAALTAGQPFDVVDERLVTVRP